MLDEGTAHYDAVGLAEAVDRLGASLNTFASWDASYVDLTVLRPRLEAALELMAEVVVEPTFPEDEFERVRRERAIRVQQSKDDARTLADNQFARLLFGEAHPYGRPLLGTPELETVGRDEVLAAYRETFRAGNAGLIVAGDITADELRGLLEPTLGRMPEGEGPALDVPAPPSLAGPRIYLVDKPGAAQSEVRVGRVALPRATPEYYPAIVTNTVLGGSFTSRLNSTLREEKGYTYGAGSSFQMRRHAGPFVARAGVFTPVTDSSVVEFVRQIRRMHDEPVPEDELARAKNYVALRLPQRFETVSDLANRVSELVLYELPDDTWDGYVDGVLAVDQDDVLAFARRWLDVNDMVIVVAGDRSVIEQPLRDLGIAEVVVVPPEAVF
ncbi:MAG: insulinase family protein [Gemmatimonadetes bacterium]|nr:MAG: insulinase family protein [Gemmatimonadota bacterium]